MDIRFSINKSSSSNFGPVRVRSLWCCILTFTMSDEQVPMAGGVQAAQVIPLAGSTA